MVKFILLDYFHRKNLFRNGMIELLKEEFERCLSSKDENQSKNISMYTVQCQ